MASTISSIPHLQSPTLTQGWDMDGISRLSHRDLTLPGNNNGHIPKIREKYPRTLQDIIEVTNRILRHRTSPLNHNHNHDQNQDEGCQNIRSSFSKGFLSNRVRMDQGKSVESPPLRPATNPHTGVFGYGDNPPRELRTYTGKYELLGTYAHNVHRKSNEQIRPARRPCRHHRSLGTPTLYKSVRFDSVLENIRYFHEMDRPFDINKDTSPVTDCDEPDLFPPPYCSLKKRALSYEWELFTPNFPHDTAARETMPVRLERVYLSNDQMAILGSVIVANLAFEKSVVCRFTFDFWKTIWETTAKYDHDTNPGEMPGYDRFVFSIMLTDTVDFEAQPLFVCIRYGVNGQEYWDNNSGTNFQVDVIKTYPCWGNKGKL